MEKLTWEYYNSHFPKLNEERFKQLLYRCEKLVNQRLPKRDFVEKEIIDIHDCICEIINEIDIQESSNGISSVSNDGYSESYVIKAEQEKESSIDSIIYRNIGYIIPRFIGF